MAKQSHSHPCVHENAGCTNQVPCGGEWVRNHDGIPDVICDAYHGPYGVINALRCEECQDSECSTCGSVTRLEGHDEQCPEHHDNREPPDPWEDVATPFARNH